MRSNITCIDKIFTVPKDKLVYTYTCIGEERALRTDTDINDTVKISPIPICGICIGASLM